jgi:hypothetical protein
MARITPSPLVGSIRGSIGSITFASPSSGAIARIRQRHRTNLSPAQVASRSEFVRASKSWRSLSSTLRAAWSRAAVNISTATNDPTRRVSGYALYMQSYALAAASGTISTTAPPTALASTPILIAISNAESDTPSLTLSVLGFGIAATSQVYVSCATAYSPVYSSSMRNWRYIGSGEYQDYPLDLISGYLAAYGTPALSTWCIMRIIVIEPGQVPSPPLLAPFLWHLA